MSNWLSSSTGASDIWTISELNRYVRELFDIDFRLQDVEVEGEISNFVRARSGHLYFTLKDGESQLKCVMWRTAAQRLRFDPQDGDAVTARGRVSVYEAGGVYQLYAERLRQAGIGDLALAFEQLKQKLADEGLFDPERKRKVPAFPRKIGIVTSLDAAALRDILNVLDRRYPLVSVLIAPTLVQGTEAPGQIVAALQRLDARPDIDVILVARGGGSMEDLWAFNDERVVRAVAAAQHPVISGVGHETDFTITDFVADVRAPTPSAAAELAVPDLAEIMPAISGASRTLDALIMTRIAEQRQTVSALRRTLGHLSPRQRLDAGRQRLDNLTVRLDRSLTRRTEQRQAALTLATARLEAVSPQATLARGYAIVRQGDGRIVRQAGQVRPGDPLTIQVGDGTIPAVVRPLESSDE